ncbi:MAG TPA: thiamine pyrophosphate-binding protein, partial [Pseudonocardia sp.]|nr:thiamine pyrophosphate-binding protein [Pseudonocardia sp.]
MTGTIGTETSGSTGRAGSTGPTTWHRIDGTPDEGRVRTAVVDGRSIALTRCGGRLGALDNHCPHQGGPLGEGSIENGWLRCPWHGYDYDPATGRPPEGFTDAPVAYAVQERPDGAYVALPDPVEHPRSVSDVLVETLVAWGVDTVFGMVGHSNLGFADALRRAEERGELRYVGIRHEGAAAFAASAYGKLTGRPAACLAIAGPGSTNLLTGLYDAKLDGAPVLAISGQVPSAVLGRGAFQDVDLSAVFRDVAVSTVTVHAGSDHAELAATAVKHAVDGRGVAHLVLPDEVQVLPSDAPAARPAGRRAARAVAPPPASLDAALDRLRAAHRPVLVVGQGARGAAAEVRALAERLGAPVLTTFRAKGLVPDTHPLGAGVLGRSGTPVASWLMNESDLLLVLGASFSNHTGIAPYKPIVQVDDAPSAIGRFHGVEVGVLGDAAVTLRALCDRLGD